MGEMLNTARKINLALEYVIKAQSCTFQGKFKDSSLYLEEARNILEA